MYARFVTLQFQPGKLDEALHITNESIRPELRQQAGFQGTTVLLDRSNNKVVAISLWQTEADLQASGASISHPSVQARLAKVSSLFAAAPLVETYEVAVQE